ncbi:MAG: EAL domain-containing protein [Agathobacter sp.]|nr:EAL domain-containing protein [Agathobacter sp.]
MATRRENEAQEPSLVDENVLQRFQDRFSEANCIYLSCLGTEDGLITKSFGDETAKSYFQEQIGQAAYMSLLAKAKSSIVENLVEEELPQKHIKLCAVSTRIEGRTQIIWIVNAVIRDLAEEGCELPDGVVSTTEERFYRSMQFLEYLSKTLFVIKMDEQIAQEALQQSAQSEADIERQLHRSETMTQIVNMLESENGFGKIVDDILKMVCNCLDLSRAALVRENVDGQTLDMICEYAKEREWYRISEYQKVSKEDAPFFNGKSYMISSDSMIPESFARIFKADHITAAIYHPIVVNERAIMYLCFFEQEKERIWSADDVKFINDVKRIIQSILTKRITKNSLASSYASLEAILENVGCGIYVLDQEKKAVLYTNQKFKELFANSISNGKINQILFSDREMGLKNYFEEVFFAEEDRWLDVHKSQIDWVDGRKVSLCTIYDITDKKVYQKKIESQANNDFLTGLFNRMRCEQDLDRFIRLAELNGTEGALLYIDLDDFKHINDGLGHQYGDVLLKAISHSLQKIEGVENTCYRMGGDEFIVIIPDNSDGRLEAVTKSVQSIFSQPWFLKGEDYYCTMSMGIACFPTDANSVQELIRKADMALFSAKKEGKNRIEFYNDKDAVFAHRRLDMEKNMRKATLDECKEFEVYYQPIVDITKPGDPCCGAEALVRWNSSEMGFVSPVDFIPLAEYLGLINPIGDYVLREAAKRCRYWNEMGHPEYKVNVNLSVVQLLQNDIVKKVKAVLDETRVNPQNLTLEVTESLAINDIDRMKTILAQIKSLGVRVALDDFGTGYSSLNHIRELPIDILKIDRCFIEHIADDDFSDAFVKMVSELAATLGLFICTEGVEATEQYEMVKNMHIKYIQGYYFGKPMRIEEFESKYL